ncbi:Conserved hypothetical protein [Synechococcus sp. RCC307]|nr:Conserved hypothetical protein [Synechococcus sp. RCC307]
MFGKACFWRFYSLKKALRHSLHPAVTLERNCWMVVHQHRHGMFPSEYDIREIDEDLYLALLAYCRN